MNGARLAVRPLLAGLALLLGFAPLSAPPAPARAQSTYIPRPPEPDSVLYPVPTKDPRVAPRDAHNPFATDPHVPKSEAKVWVNRDYYSIGIDEQSTFLIPVVENGHLGPKTNPRGFWPRYNEGNMIVALAELKYVLWVFPNHPQALHLLGIVSKRLHDTSIPIAFYEKALRLFPDRASTRAQYGGYLVGVGERAQGISQLEHALRLDPMNLTARAWLDKARRGLGIQAGPAESAVPATPSSRSAAPSASSSRGGPGKSAPIPEDPPAQSGGMYVPRR